MRTFLTALALAASLAAPALALSAPIVTEEDCITVSRNTMGADGVLHIVTLHICQ